MYTVDTAGDGCPWTGLVEINCLRLFEMIRDNFCGTYIIIIANELPLVSELRDKIFQTK
jgi:hypothetical protein